MFKIIRNTGRVELKWRVSYANEKGIVGVTNPSLFSGNWGERITVFYSDGLVYLNSICDPQKEGSIISKGRNKKNIEAIVTSIKNYKN